MTVPIAFTKVSGAGNDFVVVNNFQDDMDVDFASLARIVCDRHFGVGADGLLVLKKSSVTDFAMVYYNADGSWGGMCGNGGRCIARFAFLEGIAGPRQKFEALGHIYEAEVRDDVVSLRMKDPADFRTDITLSLSGIDHPFSFLNTGAPHAVLTDESNWNDLDVRRIGRELRRHPLFAPDGTNVNFLRREDSRTVRIRTYERGVEDETLACGTGAVASALIAAHLYTMGSPVNVAVLSGETLRVHFAGNSGSWTDVRLEGSAHMLFSGTFVYETDPPSLRADP